MTQATFKIENPFVEERNSDVWNIQLTQEQIDLIEVELIACEEIELLPKEETNQYN